MTEYKELAARLTETQAGMLDACMSTGAAWVTAVGSDNDDMLQGWVDRGWAESVKPPSGLTGLVAYRILPAAWIALLPEPSN